MMKKRVSKLTALLLALAVSIGILSGCGTAPQPDDPANTPDDSQTASPSGTEAPEKPVQAGSYEEVLSKLDYDPEVMPDGHRNVVYVTGSWYDMGYQYSTQVPDVVKRNTVTGISYVGPDTWEETKAAAAEYIEYYKGVAPELVELYRGMAEGIGLTLEDFAVSVVNFASDHETTGDDVQREDDGCSSIAAWGESTAGGQLIVGANWDAMGSDSYYEPVVVAYPENGNAFITESGWEGNLSINNVGLACSGSSGQSAGEGDNAVGMPVMTDLFLLASSCSTAEEALNMYLDKDMHAIYGENMHANDINGGHVVLEVSAAHNNTRRSGDFDETDYLITTNDFMTEEMQSSLLPPGSGYDDCRPRYWTLERVLLDAGGQADLHTVADAIGCTDFYIDGQWNKGVFSMDTGLNSPESLSPFYQNLSKALAVPELGTMYVMSGCSNTNVTLLPEAAGCYIQVTMARNPAESASNARTTSNLLIFSAGSYIDNFSGDTAELVKALDMAKRAQIAGDNYFAMAGCAADETQALDLYSRAASQYMKAQVYAQHAQNDLQAVLDY